MPKLGGLGQAFVPVYSCRAVETCRFMEHHFLTKDQRLLQVEDTVVCGMCTGSQKEWKNVTYPDPWDILRNP